jgi:hypothetical protein
LSVSDLDDVPRVGSLKPELLSRPRLFSGSDYEERAR